MESVKLDKIKCVHFTGIKGVAMTALALYCQDRGMKVTGSDVEGDFPTQKQLEQADIPIFIGFDPQNIQKVKPDLVIFTGAHNGCENPEVIEAKRMGIQTLAHGRALGLFMEGATQVSIAGSHGKTTTSAMIATILTSAGFDPSYAIGCGEIFGLGHPGHFGRGKIFVAEADEYITDPKHDLTPRFLWQYPDVLVVTNIDYDHPDAYVSLESVQTAFVSLQKQEKGIKKTVYNQDDLQSKILAQTDKSCSYGEKKGVDYGFFDILFEEGKTFFTVSNQGASYKFELHVPGIHNVRNATAAIAACRCLQIPWAKIQQGLLAFGGTKRRFEKVGTINNVLIYDDYAHHPAEIRATLAAARNWYSKRRIVAVFQPHTYSRTKALFSEFSQSFKQADIVIISDIYASARESETLGMNAQLLVQEINKYQSPVIFGGDKKTTIRKIKENLLPDSIVIFMGAGDIYEWSRELING